MMHYVSHHTNEKLEIKKRATADLSPWQKLANAIVEQAVDDYRKARARLKANPMTADRADCEIRQLERFFRSSWFEVLTDVDGRTVLARLRKEVA